MKTNRWVATGLALSLASQTAMAESESQDPALGKHEGTWNQSRLVDWVATLGDGTSPYDELEAVRNFEELQRAIEEVKQMVLDEARSETEAVEGLRMILKHLASVSNDALTPDLRTPLIAKGDPRVREIGAYNPDAEYDQATIDGRYDYKLTGDLGTVPYVSITVNGEASGRLSRLVAYLDNTEIRKHTDERGRFTLWLTDSKPNEPGAWVALPDRANGVVIRQYVADRTHDELASFAIEAIGPNRPDGHANAAELSQRFAKAADYLVVSSTWHQTLLPQMRSQPNRFFASDASSIGASAANAENYYQMAYYEIDEGESLVIDMQVPNAPYWNLTTATIWHESHRYLQDPVSMTSSEAARKADGRVRFVLSSEDPGHPNWLDTFGHERGFLILRIVGVREHPLAETRKISAKELRAQLRTD